MRVPVWPTMALLMLLAQLLWAMPAQGAPALQDLKAQVSATEKKLNGYALLLKQKKRLDDKQLSKLINDLSALRAESLDRVRQLSAASDAANTALEQATPKTGENGKPAATDPVAAAKLKTLQRQVAAIEGLLVRAKLNANQADQLAQQVSDRRKALYFSTVFSRSLPPLSATVRTRLAALAGESFAGLKAWLKERSAGLSPGQRVLRAGAALLSLAVLVLLASPFYGWLERRAVLPFLSAGPDAPGGADRRLTIALVRTLVRAGAFVLPALLLYLALRLLGVIAADEARLVFHALLTVSGVVLADAMATGLLSPNQPALRLVNLSDRQAAALAFFAMAALWVFALDHLAAMAFAHAHMRLSLETVQAQSAVTTLSASILVLLAGLQVPWRMALAVQGGGAAPRFRFAMPDVGAAALQALVILAALTGIISALAGYVEFGRTLIWTVILATLVLAGFVLVRHSVNGIFALLWTWLWGGPPQQQDKGERPGGIIMNIWLRLFADIALVAVAAWVFLHLANFRVSDLDLWLNKFFTGIPLGATVIRPVAIFWAIAAFMLVSLLFRILRAYLRKGMEVQGELAGANASILALVGYVGFIIALLVGFSALGLPFSNIALIASGLSLGIGFGLKDIVNNFISGLILLFERPIKIGDWVVSSAGQGLVKNIGLRATEITTFDRASIMVPNSELVSSPLTNWTHKDRTGRTTLRVGVAYGTDPDLVRDILLQCASAHDSVLHRPKPAVYWVDFGDSALIFELRAFTNIRSQNDMVRLESELRFAIYAAFAEQGIKIPFPQRDVHLVPPAEDKPARKSRKKRSPAKPKPAS